MDVDGNGDGANGALAVQVEKLEERIDRDETANTKEHDEIRKQLQKVIDEVIGESLKRWPPVLAALVAILSSVCTGLIVYLVTHPRGL